MLKLLDYLVEERDWSSPKPVRSPVGAGVVSPSCRSCLGTFAIFMLQPKGKTVVGRL